MASKITQAMREQVLADYDACKHIATVAKQNGLSEPTIRKIIVQERGENAVSRTRGAASESVTARCTATKRHTAIAKSRITDQRPAGAVKETSLPASLTSVAMRIERLCPSSLQRYL